MRRPAETTPRLVSLASLALAAAFASGCYGATETQFFTEKLPEKGPEVVFEPTVPAVDDCEGAPVEPGPSPLRKLTREEYDNTVRDLFTTTLRPGQQFPEEEEVLGFNNNADLASVSTIHAERYMEAAETLAAAANLSSPDILPCLPSATGCARKFVETFGKRAFRRALTSDEASLYEGFHGAMTSKYGFNTATRLTIQAFLQSPQFLYRLELTGGPVGEVISPSADELASRLSYLLWGSMPDDELLRAAAAGELESEEGLRAQAERMVADPKARVRVASFHRQWLALDAIDEVLKNDELYPTWPSLKTSMKKETELFTEEVFFKEGGSGVDLFSATYTFVDNQLARHYGSDAGTQPGFFRIEIPRTANGVPQRAGVLTQGSFLAHHAGPFESSPVHRGVFVRDRILCQPLPPPPDDIPIIPPDPDPNLTTRERFAAHTDNVQCSGCHKLIDPVGFGFESYDAVGRYRETDNGSPVDASGELFGVPGADGDFFGGVELTQRIAKTETVQACLVTNWFRFAYGRGESELDRCTIKKLNKTYAANGYDLKKLYVSLALTDAFRFRRAVATGGTP